jgi:hypothetical protein
VPNVAFDEGPEKWFEMSAYPVMSSEVKKEWKPEDW